MLEVGGCKRSEEIVQRKLELLYSHSLGKEDSEKVNIEDHRLMLVGHMSDSDPVRCSEGADAQI